MLRSIGKQSGESAESVPKKKRKATVGRICRTEVFKTEMKEWVGNGKLIIISMTVSSITAVYKYISQIKYSEAVWRNSIRKLYGLKLSKCWLQLKNKLIVLFIVIFGTLSLPIRRCGSLVGWIGDSVYRKKAAASWIYFFNNYTVLFLTNLHSPSK